MADIPNKVSTTSSSPSPARRLHPLIATAAGAVIVASLAATAALTGIFPKASSSNAQTGQTQAATVTPQPAESTSPSATAAQQQAAQQQAQQQAAQNQAAQQQQLAQQPPAQPAAPPQPNYQQKPAYCSTCGTVESVSAVKREGHGTGIGAVGGAVAGGVVGNQFGGGGGRTAMTLLGALGGGLAGNSVEKHIRSETDYTVHVRMENGKYRTFTYREPPPFQQGQPVRVRNGTLSAG